MENQNKYIQIDSIRKQKDFPVENNGNFQNILKLLTEQRSKIDEMLVKTRNYQVSRQRQSRANISQEGVEDTHFIEDISGYQNGASQTVEELRKKIDTLKKRHKSDVNGNIADSVNQQNQIAKKQNVHNPSITYKRGDSNFISPKKERLALNTENAKQPISQYLKDYDITNHPQSNKSQQRNHPTGNNANHESVFQESKGDNIEQQNSQMPHLEQQRFSSLSNHQIQPPQANSHDLVSLPPIQQYYNLIYNINIIIFILCKTNNHSFTTKLFILTTLIFKYILKFYDYQVMIGHLGKKQLTQIKLLKPILIIEFIFNLCIELFYTIKQLIFYIKLVTVKDNTIPLSSKQFQNTQ